MKQRIAASIPDLIEALGGYASVAEWAGYEDVRGVYNWVSRGAIPRNYHLRLALEAMRRGVAVAPDVFGLEDDDALTLDRMMRPPKRCRGRPQDAP